MQSIRYSCQILMKGEFPRQIFDILPVGAELFHADRQRDKHDEANSRFSQFCERA
jgi:hypothetical protein